MLLEPQKKFYKYIVGNRREGCGYREVYDAMYNDRSVVLIVYDVEKTPCALFTSMDIGDKLTSVPWEAKVLSQLESGLFPKLLECGVRPFKGNKISFLCLDFYPPTTLVEMITYDKLSESEILTIISKIIEITQELYRRLWSCHFNICPQSVVYDELHGPIIQLVGLDHVGKCSNGVPWFDTNTLNHCCRPPESFLGLFDRSADVYAIGMVMAYMFRGKYPYPIDETMSPKEVCDIIKKNTPQLDGVPERFHTFILRAIEKKAFFRFSSVNELAMAFSCIISEETENGKIRLPQTDLTSVGREQDCRQQQAPGAAHRVDIGVRHGKGFCAVAGMDSLKNTLKTNFVDIISHRELAQTLGIEPPNMLLYGPPGNGKTYIVERLAEECGMEYSYVQPSSIGSIYIHGSQTMIAELFTQAEEKAKRNPNGCLLLIDEIDAVCPIRTNDDSNHQAGEVAEFLTQLNNCVAKNVFVVGTTNRIGSVDRAVLRAGRIEQIIYIGLPDNKCRQELFDYELGQRPHSSNIDTASLAQQTEGYTSADIAKIVKLSSRHIFNACLNNDLTQPVITQECLERTIRECRPSVTINEMREYERQRDEFNAGGVALRKRIGF